jgi:hypothetical protein
MPRRSWILLSLLLLAGSACRRASEEAPLPADPVESPINVEVVNNQPLPVEILIVGSGVNHRLGTVHPGMTAHFEVPPGMVGNGSLELLARSSGAQTARSGPLLLSPGATVDFVVARPPFNSTATLRP